MIGKIFRWDREEHKLIEITPQPAPDVDAPAVWRDEILDGIESPLSETNEKYYSRSKYLKHIKDSGFEVTGGSHLTGNKRDIKKLKEEHREDIRNDIMEARRALEWGEVPLTEREKEQCRREQREIESYQKRQKTRWA